LTKILKLLSNTGYSNICRETSHKRLYKNVHMNLNELQLNCTVHNTFYVSKPQIPLCHMPTLVSQPSAARKHMFIMQTVLPTV
jgi:hypothetical protein